MKSALMESSEALLKFSRISRLLSMLKISFPNLDISPDMIRVNN